jgi:hypothetical protein
MTVASSRIVLAECEPHTRALPWCDEQPESTDWLYVGPDII